MLFRTALFLMIILSAISLPVFGEYSIRRSSIDGGSGVSSGGQYTLNGIVGQPEAGVMEGGDFTLGGGFWAGTFGCIVNIDDLAIFSEQWLSNDTDLTADLYIDGKVDLLDYSILASYWLCYCPADWPLK